MKPWLLGFSKVTKGPAISLLEPMGLPKVLLALSWGLLSARPTEGLTSGQLSSGFFSTSLAIYF